MEQHHANMMAVSLAGHDKGKQYVVIGQEEDILFLSDGKTKLLETPKRKKKKHVQLITHFTAEIESLLSKIETDEDVRKTLKEYQKRSK